MSDVTAKPSAGAFWISVAAVIGCFLLFAAVLYTAYLPSREAAAGLAANLTEEERLERGLLTPAERAERLAELRRKNAADAAGYAWIDREKGLVRLPLDRAIDLVVPELQGKRASN